MKHAMSSLKKRNDIRSWFWFVVHNVIAHPILVLPTRWDFPDKIHDWTALKAFDLDYYEQKFPIAWKHPDDVYLRMNGYYSDEYYSRMKSRIL